MSSGNYKCKILFVCLGNICRSPIAEAVFRKHVEEAGLSNHIFIDSAATSDYNTGDRPDERSIQICVERNIHSIANRRARRITKTDFHEFDFILCMDHSNLSDLKRMEPQGHNAHVALFGSFHGGDTSAKHIVVNDPYYGTMKDFITVYEHCDNFSKNLLANIKERLC